jgi:DNA-binding helix-hairpin-helix protein with protein kinase domain
MKSLATPGLSSTAAWPTSLVFDSHSRRVRGFVMPRLVGKEIHRLYGPHDRYIEFPSAAWDFLIHVAKNSAAVFHTLHEHRIVMADVNEKNLLVTDAGRLWLVDCDSYQIPNDSGVFCCDVGVPLWTAPELQGREFRGLVRTKNHDHFGLAVLMFQLLFMGRHPFAGVPDRPEHFEIELAIRQFLFAFTPKTRPLGIRPPPHALPLSALPDNVIHLFERAFLPGSEGDSARPSGRDWYQALDLLSKNLRACSRDPGHKYPSHRPNCPWCEIYDAGGPNFFISVAIEVSPQSAAVNVAAYWVAIQQLAPHPLRAKEWRGFAAPAVTATPLPHGLTKRRPKFYFGWLAIAASIGLIWIVGWFAAIGILFGLGMVAEGSSNPEYSNEANRRRQSAQQLRQDIERSITDAKRIIMGYDQQFRKRKGELHAAYDRYLRLDQEKREQLRKLEAEKRDLQMKEFLDRILIRDHEIPEIRTKRKQALQAYGVESALDISPVMAVPGFGDHLKSVLVRWRRQHEARFRYNPAIGIPQKELHQLNLRITNLRRSLEIELRSGPQSINEITSSAEQKLRECEARTADLVRRKAQADADAALCS